jgi:two-component system heavy metal sensor histidine kinase CusS
MASERRAGARSLTLRLVLGYTLVAALVLSASALFLYRGLAQGFVVEDTELLSDQVEEVRGLMAKGDLEQARRFILAAAGERDLEKYYGRLLDEQGRVVVETPGMARVAPAPSDFPNSVSPAATLRRVTLWRGAEERLALLASAKVARSVDQPPWAFQIALDAEHVDTWLGKYRSRLFWMVGAGTICTALLGYVIVFRGLKPLREITDEVKGISAYEMSGDLDARRWPAEMAVLAKEFSAMLERLRASFEQMSRFSADVAHEFRTPLNNLMGGTSLTLSRPRTAEDYRSALEGNLEQFERLRRMVESLLFIARAENAEAVVNKRPCDAGMVARDVCDFFSALAEERQITLSCEGDGIAHADEVLLRLALTNLVSNALRHTPQGGSVSLSIGKPPVNGACEIRVADTGAGISPDHHARLFDRFYRVDAARAEEQGGSGLGLAIVKTVMNLHGGTVTVESAPGAGAIFRAVFPGAV